MVPTTLYIQLWDQHELLERLEETEHAQFAMNNGGRTSVCAPPIWKGRKEQGLTYYGGAGGQSQRKEWQLLRRPFWRVKTRKRSRKKLGREC